MRSGKMPPKTKKEKQKEAKKIVEDKTFGLKKKNKSKKVQQYVTQVEKQAKHKVEAGTKKGAGGASTDQAKMTKKAMMEARMAELTLLGRPVKDKEKKLSPEEEEKRRKAEEEELERLRILALPVEDQIEEERAKLKEKTPVTLELFLEWKEKKKQEIAVSQFEKKRAAALKTGLTKGDLRKGGLLTGKELFEYNRDVFVDDEGADDAVYERNEDYQSSEEEDEERDGDVEEHAENGEGDEHPEPEDKEIDDAGAVGDESLFS